ncbi:hypothetical protein PCASD_25164 [Puccinia coronata f. sp. avenae]|uniref:Uncharacterized protein n=1 Tax=Puccinia coronata f. sp. avenae TaxID=200324 RepID=A0A2N5TH84_9BASI|nr:hypothetical protein PCASD_25164 [Puccinia coronata f. sp. avenae]
MAQTAVISDPCGDVTRVKPLPVTSLNPNPSQSGTVADRKTVDVQALAALKKKYEEGCKHLSSILKEAEDILGDRVSHHKKAWSAAETTFKTSVSKWETQIAEAKTPTIDVEAEYAAVLPSIQIPKKRAAPGTSNKTAPRRRAKKNSLATTVEEIRIQRTGRHRPPPRRIWGKRPSHRTY